MKYDAAKFRLTSPGNFGRIALGIGLVGAVLSIFAYFSDADHFYFAWLTSFAFWTSLLLGALFFTMLQHLTSAAWSIVVRRLAESISAVLPWAFLFFIPVFLGMHELYHWTHEEAQADPQLVNKLPFLNVSFFTIRTAVYFLIWSLLAFGLRRASLKQDDGGDVAARARMKKISAAGMVIYALTISGAGFDWLMSLDPHWYSTIFGVYYFAGGFLGSLGLIVAIALYMRKRNVLADVITVEHYHDLGKLMFGFVIFWAYIGFSQYLLQWYGNVPEETVWYLDRWDGGDGSVVWWPISLILLFGHFFAPFTILIFRAVKRNFLTMKIMAFWILIIHWIDIYWMVAPAHFHHGPQLGWIDVVTTMAVGGLLMFLFWRSYTAAPLVPVGDGRLQQSMEFVNH